MPKDERAELIAKVTEYVDTVHSGDWESAFDAADRDNDGRINTSEVNDVLRHSGVGNFLTRSTWSRKVMEEVDSDCDGYISFDEFQAVFRPLDKAA